MGILRKCDCGKEDQLEQRVFVKERLLCWVSEAKLSKEGRKDMFWVVNSEIVVKKMGQRAPCGWSLDMW